MGNDGGFPNYMSNGDVAELLIYDATHGSILPIDVSATTVDVGSDGSVDYSGELPGWANNEIYIVSRQGIATFGVADMCRGKQHIEKFGQECDCVSEDHTGTNSRDPCGSRLYLRERIRECNYYKPSAGR